jgi:hypothetical protein
MMFVRHGIRQKFFFENQLVDSKRVFLERLFRPKSPLLLTQVIHPHFSSRASCARFWNKKRAAS